MPNDYQLWNFQKEADDWLAGPRDNGFGFTCEANVGILAHEMGLGKTAIALSRIKGMILAGKKLLFLVPGATIMQWQKQYDRWVLDNEPDEFGVMGLYAIRGSDAMIPRGMSVIMSHAMMAKTEIVRRLAAANFDGIIVDEIHKFGTLGTKRIKHLWALWNLTESKFESCRIGLTGTPVRNYAKEIYNLAHFCDPEKFRNFESFAQKYLTRDYKALWNPQQFHDDFAPYYLRRTEAEVKKDMPPIRRTKLYTEITDPFIRGSYNKQLDLLENYMNGASKVEAFSLLGYLIKLRHITGIAKAKEPAIIEPISDYLAEDKRVVIGLHHHFVRDRLRKSLKDFPCYVLEGGMTDIEKYRVIEDFKTSPKNAYMLLSIKAGGEGVDGLQYSARKAYIFERQWNGADELQFEKRVHRSGQTESVSIEYTIAAGTVDEFFDNMVEYKRKITTQVEDEHWESNPAFLKSLAESVVNNRLPSLSASEAREFKEMAIDFGEDASGMGINI